MKNLNIILSILLLSTTSSIFTATTRTSTRTKRRTPTKRPTRTPITRQQPPIQQQPGREEQLIKYDDILIFLKEKAPNSSDLPTLQNIKTEVERQINYIESTFARRFDPTELEEQSQTALDTFNRLLNGLKERGWDDRMQMGITHIWTDLTSQQKEEIYNFDPKFTTHMLDMNAPMTHHFKEWLKEKQMGL